jgi:hypothetical protein
MALTGSERGAIGRALARGGAAAVERVRYGLYRVASASRPGTAHTVSVDAAGRYHCDCEAGVAGRVCWHAAAVFVAKVEAQGVRVTGPAAPAPAGRPATVTPLPARRGQPRAA